MKRYALDARTATDHFPGIGRYVSSLAHALVDQLTTDEQLIILKPDRPSAWPLPPESDRVTHRLTAVSPFSLNQQWRIPPLLQDAHLYHSPYYLMPYRLPIPTILTIHDLIPQKYPQYVSARARLLSGRLKWLALRRAAHTIAVSQATKTDVVAAYGRDPALITPIPHAPDPRFTPQPEREIDRIHRAYNLPDFFALYIGSNKPHKNLNRLVDVWRTLPDPPLLALGGSWDSNYPAPPTGDTVRHLGRIPDDDLPGLYTAADLFIFPSEYEGFGLPVIEAMACGTAVACSRSSSLPEVGGEAADYFDPRDSADMTAVLHRLLTHPGRRAARAQAGLQQAQTFSWTTTAVRTLQIYRPCVNI